MNQRSQLFRWTDAAAWVKARGDLDQLAADFTRRYRAVRAFHAGRPVDPDAYRRHGLLLATPERLIAEAYAVFAGEEEARRVLARRCLLEPGAALSPKVVERAEEALEAVAPEMTDRAQTACPECGAVTEVPIDPYFCLDLIGQELFGEVHRIASTYHWSEPEILRLPRERRRLYLQLIDRD